MEQSVREKAELQKELDQIMEENETLKRALEKERQDAASLKVLLSPLSRRLSDSVQIRSLCNRENG